MKKVLFIIVASLFLLNSCEKDDKIYSSIVGTWQCVEISSVHTPNPYFVDIVRETSDSTRLVIDNFYNMGYGKEIYATLDGYDISLQSNLFGFSIVGEAKVATNFKTIEWEYEVDDGSGMIDYVTAVYTRN
jgi:hypothetical protein